MSRRITAWLTAVLCLLITTGAMAAAKLSWVSVPDEIRPGKTVRLTLNAPEGNGRVYVVDSSGLEVAQVRAEGSFRAGENYISWNGSDLMPGSYTLIAEVKGKQAKQPITVGRPAPVILDVECDDSWSEGWSASVEVNMSGTLTVTYQGDEDSVIIITRPVTAGVNEIPWDGTVQGKMAPEGYRELTFCLSDESGITSDRNSVDVYCVGVPEPRPAHDAEYFPPNYDSQTLCAHSSCYWKLNMGEMNESAIWQVLTAPITIIPGEERHQVKLLAEPRADCKTYTGEVTYSSQGVHVLREENGWSLVEAYSSSVEGSSVGVYAAHCQGWIPTDKLKTVEVDQTTGIVIDKLQQRLYVFRDGHLYSTLLCSTGFARKDTPFNETPAGEYLTVSWTGGFWSGSLYCDMGIRINDGILLHEVPCRISTDDAGAEVRDYTRCERYLGEKASHGCIRIQKRTSPEGVNAKWLWDHLSRKPATKVIIWDELGRQLMYPDDDFLLYYNSNGGKYYHSSPTCTQVKKEYQSQLEPFPYGELDNKPFSKLEPCQGCAPQLRHAGIDSINEKNDRTK